MSSTPDNDRFLLRRSVPSIINVREVLTRTSLVMSYSRSQSNFTQKADAMCRFNTFEDDSIIQTNRFVTLTTSDWSDEDELSDKKVLQEIMYYFQGVNGKYVSFDSNYGYKINSMPSYNDRIHLVAYILEHGWLSIHIGELLENQLPGFIRERLATSVREILVNFQKEINIFPMHKNVNLENELNVCCKGDNSCNFTNLKEGLCWARGSVFALDSIIALLHKCNDLNGCKVLDPVVKWLHHGNPNIIPSMLYIFNEAVRPMLKMLKNWLFSGELDDSYNEFFIVSNCTLSKSFNDQFVIRSDVKPNWISNSLSEYILKCGSLVNIFHNYSSCESDKITGTAEKIYNWIYDCIGRCPKGFEELTNEKLPSILEELYKTLSNDVFQELSADTDLIVHFKLRHLYILLGKGDFVNVLIKKVMNDVYGNVIFKDGICDLLSAVEDWAMPTELETVKEHFGIEIIFENEKKDPLSDFFGLHFKTQGLASLLLKPFSEVYQKIYSFLWKIQIAEHILKIFRRDVIWPLKKLKDENIKSLQPDLIEVSHILYMFVICLQNYMTGIVVDKHWNSFINKYNDFTSLEELVREHKECLKTILTETLQDRNSKDILVNITVILDLVSELRSIGEHFSKVISEVRKGQKINSFGVLLVKSKIKMILQMFKESIAEIINEDNHKKFRLFQEYMNFNDYYWKKDSGNECVKLKYYSA